MIKYKSRYYQECDLMDLLSDLSNDEAYMEIYKRDMYVVTVWHVEEQATFRDKSVWCALRRCLEFLGY